MLKKIQVREEKGREYVIQYCENVAKFEELGYKGKVVGELS